MYIHNLSPILIDFGFLEIRWYSLAYIFGIILGWWLGKKIFRFKIESQNITSVNTKDFDDLITYIILSIIIGGRFGYVVFYNLQYYISNPLDVIKIWEGGMSFHGALIGIIIGTYIFSKKKNINTFFFLDIVACVAPIGIFFGRLANFINGELYGTPSNIFWSVIFPNIDNVARHPSQLYEAIMEGIILFLILMTLAFNKKIKIGLCSSIFLIFYGFFRIIAEQFREPDIQIGLIFHVFSVGTLLSIVMIFFGLFIILKLKKNEKN